MMRTAAANYNCGTGEKIIPDLFASSSETSCHSRKQFMNQRNSPSGSFGRGVVAEKRQVRKGTGLEGLP